MLDGDTYEACRFVSCEIVYSGQSATSLRNNEFEDCTFSLEGAASSTMNFLKGMIASSDGFLLTFLRALELEPSRLTQLATQKTV